MSLQPVAEDVADEVFRAAAAGIDVPDPPVAAIVEQAIRQGRRQRRAVAGVLAAVLLVSAAGTWLGSRPGHRPRPTPPPGVVRVDNPADVAWWADGSLHLAHVTVKVPSVVDVVQVGSDAVFATGDGTVTLVDGEGRRTVIGDMHPLASLAGSGDRGWVAWVDPGAGELPQLVVYDVSARSVVSTLPLPHDPAQDTELGGGHPVAVDGNKVYFGIQDGDFAWDPTSGERPSRVDTGLLDVGAATFAVAAGGGRIDIVQPFFSVDYQRPGLGAQVSPHGAYVLTHVPGTRVPGQVRIYDTRSGERVWSGVDPEEQVDAATLGPGDEVTYAIARYAARAHRAERLQLPFGAVYELRTCHIEARTCTRADEFPRTGTVPVLAH